MIRAPGSLWIARRPRRALTTFATLLLLWSTAGCGCNMLQVRRRLLLQQEDDQLVPCEVWLRAPSGCIGWPTWGGGRDRGLGLALLCILIESVDAVASTGAALYAMGKDDVAVKFGPGGFLLAMLPLVTLVPPALPDLPVTLPVSPAELAMLRDADAAVAAAGMELVLHDYLTAHPAIVQQVWVGAARPITALAP